MTTTIPTVHDRAAIADTLHRYTAGLDLSDQDLLASSLAEDGVVDLGPALRRMGYDFPPLAPRETIVTSLIAAVGPLDTSHAISNVRVEQQDENSATVYCYAQAQHFPPGQGSDASVTRHALMMNRYTAKMVRDGEQWRIKHLAIENAWFEGDVKLLLGE